MRVELARISFPSLCELLPCPAREIDPVLLHHNNKDLVNQVLVCLVLSLKAAKSGVDFEDGAYAPPG